MAAAIGLYHDIGVSMIGNYQDFVIVATGSFNYFFNSISTVSTALTAASITPVWPTISGFA
jgi:hypothetical protein